MERCQLIRRISPDSAEETGTAAHGAGDHDAVIHAGKHRAADSARPCYPACILLHDIGCDGSEMLEFGSELFPGETVVALQAPRPLNPFMSNTGRARHYGGYRWFLGTESAPEPASFGDSLLQVEAYLQELSVPDRRPATARVSATNSAETPSGASSIRPQANAPVLIGLGQGATLALALGAYRGDVLRATVAIGGVAPHTLFAEDARRLQNAGESLAVGPAQADAAPASANAASQDSGSSVSATADEQDCPGSPESLDNPTLHLSEPTADAASPRNEAGNRAAETLRRHRRQIMHWLQEVTE